MSKISLSATLRMRMSHVLLPSQLSHASLSSRASYIKTWRSGMVATHPKTTTGNEKLWTAIHMRGYLGRTDGDVVRYAIRSTA